MKINKNNYEAFLLDLWEGTLSDGDKIMLYNFLAENPELDETDALDLLKDVSLTKPIVKFDKTAIDFETINGKNYSFFFIAYGEGDLRDKEKTAVEKFVAHHPELAKEFDQYRRAKLPDDTIVFPNKKALHGVVTPVISFQSKWVVGIAAASVALLLWLSIPLENVEQRYALDAQSNIEIETFSSTKSARPISTQTNTTKRTSESNRNSFTVSTTSLELPKQRTHKAPKDAVIDNTLPMQQINSLAQIKAHHFSEVTAVLNPIETSAEVAIIDKKQIQEKIPTILELTTAYLQGKKTDFAARIPTAQELVNSTFTGKNNAKPIIQTSENNTTKRITLKLGPLEIERIAKK